jgi:hypothetical protein
MLISSARSQMHLSFSSYVKMNIRKIGNDFFDPGMIKRQILIGHHFRGQLNAGHNIVDGARVDVQLLRFFDCRKFLLHKSLEKLQSENFYICKGMAVEEVCFKPLKCKSL